MLIKKKEELKKLKYNNYTLIDEIIVQIHNI